MRLWGRLSKVEFEEFINYFFSRLRDRTICFNLQNMKKLLIARLLVWVYVYIS